jgi:hypothetical protein
VASPVAQTSSQPEFFARTADSSLLMRELTSLSRAEDEARRGSAPAQSPEAGSADTSDQSTPPAGEEDSKKRGIFRR